MRTGDALPTVSLQATLADAVREMSNKRMGMTAVVDAAGRIAGMFTDGDLRRALERTDNFRATRVATVMTVSPRTIGEEALAAEAAHLMDAHDINQLLVASSDGRLIGALGIHDLFHAKVV